MQHAHVTLTKTRQSGRLSAVTVTIYVPNIYLEFIHVELKKEFKHVCDINPN
jgi:hypothetical protein